MAQHVEAEILSTERSYVYELRTYLEVIVRPLRRQAEKGPEGNFITLKEAETFECHVEEIFALSKRLLRELEKPARSSSVGQIFAEHAEEIRRNYLKFVTAYPRAYSLSFRLMGDKRLRKGASTTFYSFICEMNEKQNHRIRNRSIADFLIIPIQRVPRYRLLLIEMWKKLGPGLKRDWTKEAVLRIGAVANELNRNTSHSKSMRDLKEPESKKKKENRKNHHGGKAIEEKQKRDEEGEEEDIFEDEAYEMIMQSLRMARARPPTVFYNSDDETSEVVSNIDLDAIDDEEFFQSKQEELDKLRVKNGWIALKSLPTSNPLVLLQILLRLKDSVNLFDPPDQHEYRDRKKKVTAQSILGAFIRSAYTPVGYLHPFRPKDQDIIVCGAIRSGQTPILYITECLRSTSLIPLTSLVDRVCWLESDHWYEQAQFYTGGRLVKTYGQLTQAFGGVLTKEQKEKFKVIITLRDPLDIRLSLFRHMRRIYRKIKQLNLDTPGANDEVSFDDLVKLDELVTALPFYEDFVQDCLRMNGGGKQGQLLFVFYEEVVSNPKAVVQKLAEFLECDLRKAPKLIDLICNEVTSNPDFPKRYGKNGSSFQGNHKFSLESKSKVEEKWLNSITAMYPSLKSYRDFYEAVTGNPYPSPADNRVDQYVTSNGGGGNGMRPKFATTLGISGEKIRTGLKSGGPRESRLHRLGSLIRANRDDASSSNSRGGGDAQSLASYQMEEFSQTTGDCIDPDDSDDEQAEPERYSAFQGIQAAWNVVGERM